MYTLGAQITIGNKRFTRVNEVKVSSSSTILEDTATIKLPATARMEREGEFISEVETAKAFQVGDQVTIQLGYDGNLRTEFQGYVRAIHPNQPLEIECEDATWLLKRKNVKASWRTATLKVILTEILRDTGIGLEGDPPTINFKNFYLRDISAAKALMKLKEEYGLTVYLVSPSQLYVGLGTQNDQTLVRYEMTSNVIDSDLEWESEEDVLLKVKAVHVKPDNTLVEKEVGDPDGELRTIFFYDLEDPGQLESLALEEVKKYRYSGYRGSVTTFLLPNVQVGNVALVTDPNFAERDGSYLVESVETTYGINGARRKVELGIKV